MNKNYSDEVIYLSDHTGISKYRCKAVLDDCGGDVNEAFKILSEIKANKYEKAMDTISAIARGERGSVIAVKEGGEDLFRIPCLLLIILLLLIDIPGWVIAVVILLFVVFGTEIEMSVVNKADQDRIRTVKVDEYKKRKKIERQISEEQPKGIRTGEDGYNEIIIE